MRPGRRVFLLCALLLALAGTAMARAEVVQRGGLRVSFVGKLSPHVLPRTGTAAVSASVGGRITATGDSSPPPLRLVTIAINRNGHFDHRGLPACSLDQIQPSTNRGALAACRDSLVGEGGFSAKVAFPGQTPFPSSGKMLAFNGRLHGRPVLLAHVFGTEPVPSSFTLVFEIGTAKKGTYGTVLRASLPDVTGGAGYITSLSMTLGRSFSFRGERHSYLSAGCPAAEGFSSAVFPFARVSFGFRGKTLSAVLIRSCRARGR